MNEVGIVAKNDAIKAGYSTDERGLAAGGVGATAYGEAITVYLAFLIDKMADYSSSICTWIVAGETMRNVFSRQAIPMTWDYAEINPLSNSTGSILSMTNQVIDSIGLLPAKPREITSTQRRPWRGFLAQNTHQSAT